MTLFSDTFGPNSEVEIKVESPEDSGVCQIKAQFFGDDYVASSPKVSVSVQ